VVQRVETNGPGVLTVIVAFTGNGNKESDLDA
jgi:hypothetical protein